MTSPRWLADEPLILRILHQFLDRLDNHPNESMARLQAVKLNKRDFPELFQPQGMEDPEQTWACLKDLAAHGLLRIEPNQSRRSYEPVYLNAKVKLEPRGYGQIRDWLQRPHPAHAKLAWITEVEQAAHCFPGTIELLRNPRWGLSGVDMRTFLDGLTKVGRLLDQNIYQSQISAHCFQGSAKVLDGREELLESLYPGYRSRIKLRPVLLHASLCPEPLGVLFIENEDCFLQAVDGFYPDTQRLILIYSAGFRGSAERIRHPQGARFAYLSRAGDQKNFEDCWLHRRECDWRWFFWGDLDFSGMSILAALRRQFPQLIAWNPGYTSLLTHLEQGHLLESSSKERQVDPGETGCSYADQVLLPALRTSGRGIDQEHWLPLTHEPGQ